MKYIIAIDLGTTFCKTVLFDIYGEAKYVQQCKYPIYGREEFVEQDPADWWHCVKYCIKKMLIGSGLSRSNIIAIGITGQSPSLVFLNEKLDPITPAILYMDTRYREFVKNLEKELHGFVEEKLVGNILWFKHKEPRIFENIAKVIDAKEFIGFKLTGKVTYDSVVFPRERICFIAEKIGVSRKIFGEPHDYMTPIGYVTKECSKELGIPEGIPVIIGPWDGLCSTLGAGLAKENLAMDVAGTTEIIAVVTRKPVETTHKFIMPIRHILKDYWLLYTSIPLAISLDWVNEMLSIKDKTPPNIEPYDMLELYIKKPSAYRETLYFIPLLKGLYSKPYMKGAIIGIMAEHNIGDIILSLYEGIAFTIRYVLDLIEEKGVYVEELRVGGGGSRNALLNKLKADIIGKNISVLKTPETSALGIAILASIAVGMYGDLEQAISNMVKISHKIAPSRDLYEFYSRKYSKFLKILEFLDDFYKH
ncbi:MAG: hypothetical protein DRO40_08425 [Thermoprotei archaeon]|nr:MAG: hypothetical protein DRO40_08425 [Thermoprotei archaeon]